MKKNETGRWWSNLDWRTIDTQKQEEELKKNRKTKRAPSGHSHLCDGAAIRRRSRVSAATGPGRQFAWTPSASTDPVRARCPSSSRTIFSQLRARLATPASTPRWCRKLPGSFCPAGTARSTRSPRHLKQPQGIPEKSSSVLWRRCRGFVSYADVRFNGKWKWDARDCHR